MIAELTGMDVANASIYDGASSLAEAALMAHAITERTEVVLARGVHPLYRRVTATYCDGPAIRLRDVPAPEGVLDVEAATKLIGKKTAALVVQSPNFYGCLEDVAAAAEIAHAAGALLIVVADPVNLGVLEAPGRLGADIVVGEGQGLGVPMSFGGPNLGVFAAKAELVRRMPGRLVGATVDKEGHRGFVLTLQTREQHIRRAKATSNICTNVALCAPVPGERGGGGSGAPAAALAGGGGPPRGGRRGDLLGGAGGGRGRRGGAPARGGGGGAIWGPPTTIDERLRQARLRALLSGAR